jgi:hypothetical protein
MSTPIRHAFRLAPAVLLASQLAAQCQLDWQPGVALPGPSGRVVAVENMANGDLVVGGWFLEAGPAMARKLARWDGAAWHGFGAGLDDNVYDIEVAANGDLIVAGKFENAGGQPANHVARWDGTSWSPLGLGLNGIVNCLEILPSGHIVAAGTFTGSGATSTPLIAEWDGSSWSQLGNGLVGGEVHHMERMANGELVVAGIFSDAGGTAVNGLARWNGSNWSGFPFLPLFVSTLAVAPNGDLAVAGLIDPVNFATVSVWDGSSLTTIATPLTDPNPGSPGRMFYDTNGDLLFVQGVLGVGIRPIMRWDGTTWSQVGGSTGIVTMDLHRLSSGELLAVGGHNTYLTATAPTLSTFDGTDWSPWGPIAASMSVFASATNGDLYGGAWDGAFSASAVNRWNGSQWVAVGAPLVGGVSDIAPLQSGGLLVGGYFPHSLGLSHAMLWDGATWMSISDGIGDTVNHVAEGPDGTLYASGYSVVAGSGVGFFDGILWQAVGGGLPGSVSDFTFLPNGDLIACQNTLGTFGTAQCMRWNGSSWSSFGPPLLGKGFSLLTQPDGTVLLGGQQMLSGSGSHVLVGDGVSWSALGGGFDGDVNGLQHMPNGDVLATGRFTTAGSSIAGRIARWNGTAWSAMGLGANELIQAVGLTRDGDLFASGGFTRIDGAPSAAMGRAITTCPAQVQSYGSGCIGPAGPVLLSALTSPWSGAQYRSRVYGMPSSSIAVHALGSTQVSVALAPLLPQSGSGCLLLASPDILDLVLPVAGVTEPVVSIPGSPALVGASFHQQVLALQLDPSLSLLSVSSSNGLTATVGFF